VVAAAYRQYRRELAPETYSRYLADLLDVDRHAHHGHLVVAEVNGRILGSGAFYPDSCVRASAGQPAGPAVAPSRCTQPLGVRASRRRCSPLARTLHAKIGRPCSHSIPAAFMTGAIALYEKFGYSRAPEFDVDLNAHHGIVGAAPATAFAYLRYLSAPAARPGHSRCTHHGDHAPQRARPVGCVRSRNTHGEIASPIHRWRKSMTIHARRRGANAPAYYLGRPAAFWSVALAPRGTSSSTSVARAADAAVVPSGKR
jgi:hypothetical protein